MDGRKITIKKKSDDGHRVITVRMKERTISAIDDIAEKTNRSRNEVINILLDSSVGDAVISDG